MTLGEFALLEVSIVAVGTILMILIPLLAIWYHNRPHDDKAS